MPPITQLEATANENLAETLAREMKEPKVLINAVGQNFHGVALPPGWRYEAQDLEKLLSQPRRKIGRLKLTETESFTDYVVRHGHAARSAIYCVADFTKGELGFTAILNDHGADKEAQDWRDHRAGFAPEKSEEWKRWNDKNAHHFSQLGFALFLEDNMKDITSGEGFPTGAQMLAMAVGFEAKQDMRFKSAVRLQSGGVRLEYIEDEDKGTIEAMTLFEKFQIAIPVFRADTARYPIEARLRYRVKDGSLVFWYELIRADLIMEQAARALVESVRGITQLPFYFGSPEA